MKFYRAKYIDDQYQVGAPVKAITWHIKPIVTKNAQGDSVAFHGKLTTTEVLKAGSIVVGDFNDSRTVYKVSAPSVGMAGIYNHYLAEEAQL